MYLENRRQIAEWLKQKLISYGITDVSLDSAQCRFAGFISPGKSVDTMLWQINVTATIQGVKYPENVICIGGHYDDYNQFIDMLLTNTPGADDNASGTCRNA